MRATSTLSLLVAGLLASSACFTFVSFDLEDGGGAPPATGGGGNGTGGAGGGSAGGSGGQGVGGSADPCGCELDPERCDASNCGAPGWACDPDTKCCAGVCSPVDTPAMGITDLAVQGGFVVTRAGAELQLWSGSFSAGSANIGAVQPIDDNGSGHLLSADGHMLYRPQSPQVCFGSAGRVCLADYDIADGDIDCHRFVTLQSDSPANDHVNGASLVGTRLYFTAAASTSVRAVELGQLGSGACDMDPVSPVATGVFVADMVPASFAAFVPAVSFLEYDPIGRDLWWSTFGQLGCVYREDVADCASCDAECAWEDPDQHPAFLTASMAGTFLATTTSDAAADGPILHLSRDEPPNATPLVLPEARWPMDSDDSYLYATVPGSPPSVVVLRFGLLYPDGVVHARYEVGAAADEIRAIDASHPDYVYFATESRLYRARKPACPYPGSCGDGCRSDTEECDDGNSASGDGCDFSCSLESP